MRIGRGFCLLVAALWLAGCGGARPVVFSNISRMGEIQKKTIDRCVWEIDLKPEENIAGQTILSGDLASYHVVTIRHGDRPHKHDFHDLAVFVQSGKGIVFLENRPVEVGPGSMVLIPHGISHYFVNMGSDPAVMIRFYSPSYDGTSDEVTVEQKKFDPLPLK